MAIQPMQMLVIGEFLEKHNASSGIMETFQAICEELVEGQKPSTNSAMVLLSEIELIVNSGQNMASKFNHLRALIKQHQ